jgi:hypothetical protein
LTHFSHQKVATRIEMIGFPNILLSCGSSVRISSSVNEIGTGVHWGEDFEEARAPRRWRP